MNKAIQRQTNRNKVINIRLTPLEYKTLNTKALSEGKNLSSYIREKGIESENLSLDDIPRQIDTWNMVNEIYHETLKCPDKQTKEKILSIIKKYATNQRRMPNE